MDIAVSEISSLGRMNWPWWGGIGVRIGKGLVAFMPSSGAGAVVETAEPVSVRTPMAWTTSRVVIGVRDVEAFIDAVAEARRQVRSADPG
jgi:hypothetical protein